MDINEKVYNLVKEQYSKMTFSKKYSNQAILSSKCQDIIYDEWGISNNNLWQLVRQYVEEFIPDELD